MNIARVLTLLAIPVSLAGAFIHVGALVAGRSWFVFFNAPPSVLASYEAGTWFAPLSCITIAGLMGTCAYYAASVVGLVRRPPLQGVGLAAMATICIVRALLLPVLAVVHPELRNTFEIAAALVWGLAGLGFASGFALARAKPNTSRELHGT